VGRSFIVLWNTLSSSIEFGSDISIEASKDQGLKFFRLKSISQIFILLFLKILVISFEDTKENGKKYNEEDNYF